MKKTLIFALFLTSLTASLTAAPADSIKYYLSTDLGIIYGGYTLNFGYLPKNIEVGFNFNYKAKPGYEQIDSIYYFTVSGWDTVYTGLDTVITPITEMSDLDVNWRDDNYYSNYSLSGHLFRLGPAKKYGRIWVTFYHGAILSFNHFNARILHTIEDFDPPDWEMADYQNLYKIINRQKNNFVNIAGIVGLKSEYRFTAQFALELKYQLHLKYSYSKVIQEQRLLQFDAISNSMYMWRRTYSVNESTTWDFYSGTVRLLLKYFF